MADIHQEGLSHADLTPPTLREATAYWFKLGLLSFGGPAGQIAMMHHDLVDKKRWISDKRFLHALNYCMILPGPEAQQLATYIGWLMHRSWGGLIAGGLFVLPSLLILIALSFIYMRFGNLPEVAAMLNGVKPAVVAIVLFAAYRIGSRVLKNKLLWGIAFLAFSGHHVISAAFSFCHSGSRFNWLCGAPLFPQSAECHESACGQP